MRYFILGLIAVLVSGASWAKRSETEVSTEWCELNGGAAEYRTDEGQRMDCWLPDAFGGGMVVEHDWSTSKVYESIGQALYYKYAMEAQLGRPVEAAIVIIRDPRQSDRQYSYHMRVFLTLMVHNPSVRFVCITEDLTPTPCQNW